MRLNMFLMRANYDIFNAENDIFDALFSAFKNLNIIDASRDTINSMNTIISIKQIILVNIPLLSED